MFGALAERAAICHGVRMDRRNPAAGGFFLTAAILTGVAWGLWQGELMLGALIGTAVGALFAVMLWLVDRRRR